MKILVLEDDSSRCKKIVNGLDYSTVVWVTKAKDAIDKLLNDKYDIIMLDHDLSAEHYETYKDIIFSQEVTRTVEPTGMMVAEWLCKNKVDSTVLVHSLNTGQRQKMVRMLCDAGYECIDAAFCWDLCREYDHCSILKLYGLE